MMETHPAIQTYRRLELELATVRETHRGADSEEEDAVLDEMDVAWKALSTEERTHIQTARSPHYDALVKW